MGGASQTESSPLTTSTLAVHPGLQGSHPHLGAPASSLALLPTQPVLGCGMSPGPAPSTYISSTTL